MPTTIATGRIAVPEALTHDDVTEENAALRDLANARQADGMDLHVGGRLITIVLSAASQEAAVTELDSLPPARWPARARRRSCSATSLFGHGPAVTDADRIETAPTPESERAARRSALVTEHFVLQSGAGATIREERSRASISLAVLSGGLVAIGASRWSADMLPVLAASPTVFLLGWFTVRLIDTSFVAVVAQQRIETICCCDGGLSRSASQVFPSMAAAR